MKKFKFCLTNLNTKVYQLYLKQNTNQNLFAYVRFYSTKLFVSELWKQSDTQKCIKEMQDWRRERKCNQKLPRCKFICNASKFRIRGSGLRSPISLILVFQVINKLKKVAEPATFFFLEISPLDPVVSIPWFPYIPHERGQCHWNASYNSCWICFLQDKQHYQYEYTEEQGDSKVWESKPFRPWVIGSFPILSNPSVDDEKSCAHCRCTENEHKVFRHAKPWIQESIGDSATNDS